MILTRLFAALLAALILPAIAAATPNVPRGSEPVPGVITLIQAGYERCGFCTVMEGSIEYVAEAFKNNLAVRYVDVLHDVAFRKKYDVDAAPAQLIFGADGKLLVRHIGFCTRAELLDMLKGAGVH